MKLIKKILSLFSAAEMLILILSVTISTFIIIPVFSNDKNDKVTNARNLFPSEQVYNTAGAKVDIFDTIFYVRYVTKPAPQNDSQSASDVVANEIVKVLNEYLVPYHKLFDRHNDYFAVKPANEKMPTNEEKETLPLIHNLKYINDHIGEEVEIAKPLYDLLKISSDYSINTPNNAFSMFIGDVYDFWSPHIGLEYDKNNDPIYNAERKVELEELVSYIPLTESEINETLILRDTGDKYYVTFNEFNNSGEKLSISVGAVAKGMMTDILHDALIVRGLTDGYINGGQSSIAFLESGFDGKPLEVKLKDIGAADFNEFKRSAFKFTRDDKYQISTSGIYEGSYFYDDDENLIIRSHIVNPLTGYPIQHDHRAVSIVSNTLTSSDLDYLSTTLTVLERNEGLSFIKENFPDNDINLAYIGVDNKGWYVAHTDDFPGENSSKFSVDSNYREIFLDFLQ